MYNQPEVLEPDTAPLSTADLVKRDASAPANPNKSAAPDDGHRDPLFVASECDSFRGRWHDIQGSFVDQPRQAVQQADELVAAVIQRLAQVFADERAKMEKDWSAGEDVSTEDLRQSLRRYRSFFDRLLTV